MMKVRPTFYTFILSKEFENRNEILDEIISYLQTMNIEIDEHKDFCIKYDKYFMTFLGSVLSDTEASEVNKKDILKIMYAMLNNQNYYGLISKQIPNILLEYSPTSSNRNYAAYLLDKVINLTSEYQK